MNVLFRSGLFRCSRCQQQIKILSNKTYHFSVVTEKRRFFVLLVAEDLYLSPLRMDANLQGNLFLYHLKAVECFLTLNFGITDYDILHLNWPDFPIVSAVLV